MNTQDLLCHYNLLDDVFSFLLLPVPQFRFNDASFVEVRAPQGIFNSQALGRLWWGWGLWRPSQYLQGSGHS